MPPVLIAVAAAAGIYAGLKLIARGLELQAEAAMRRKDEAQAKAAAPRDLGALEWDEAAGVYRPRAPRSA